MTTFLLILHGLVSVGLLGAVTHQCMALYRPIDSGTSFLQRYAQAGQAGFATAIVILYVATVVLGALIYPVYRVDVRIAFEEMALGWAVGLFELKEHFGGIGLAVLPLYLQLWRPRFTVSHSLDRKILTSLLAFIVWWNFLVGHLLNNIRGLG